MSGGVAFVYDLKGGFPKRINQDLAAGCGPVEGNDVALIRELFPTNLPPVLKDILSDDDAGVLRELIEAHVKYTGSKRGQAFLDNWDTELTKFVKVISPEYQRLLHNRKAEKDLKALGEK
jgi:glutamate synthase domain-containing protein 3